MEMKFSASIALATRTVLDLEKGGLYLRPKGAEPELCSISVQRPVWCNFVFFSRIKPRKIERTRRIDPTEDRHESWDLERTVEFFYRGARLAEVQLVGRDIDGLVFEEELDNGSFWAVSRIAYLRHHDATRDSREFRKDWIEIELDVTSLRIVLLD